MTLSKLKEQCDKLELIVLRMIDASSDKGIKIDCHDLVDEYNNLMEYTTKEMASLVDKYKHYLD